MTLYIYWINISLWSCKSLWLYDFCNNGEDDDWCGGGGGAVSAGGVECSDVMCSKNADDEVDARSSSIPDFDRRSSSGGLCCSSS